MVRTAFWYGMGWMLLVVTSPLLLMIRLFEVFMRPAATDHLTARLSSGLSRGLFYLTGSAITLSGLEHIPADGAVLFVSNHQGHMDSLIIHGFIPKAKGFISIVEVLKLPIIRIWMRRLHCVFLDRQDPRQSSSCISQAIEILRAGHSMVVFPEGKLSDGSRVDEFNRGWLRLATRSGVPIVPVSISGSYQVLSKDGKRVRPAAIRCDILQPLQIRDLKKAEETGFIEALRATIAQNVVPVQTSL